jgi:hypothetical protein
VLTEDSGAGFEPGSVLDDGTQLRWVGRTGDFPAGRYPSDLAVQALGNATLPPLELLELETVPPFVRAMVDQGVSPRFCVSATAAWGTEVVPPLEGLVSEDVQPLPRIEL